ncbi:hypothetical protein CROQUDRAFT_708021 [Cronartium quercuum f. sp. fusiforme G11]|uniref:Uncharacterized protein n=1 Tax=Cronartium quercuum f. sp. fusiforme G11 TaxID=708437 RepID=A0A9P6TAR9_9BASI|nr:hypothetical protein CROQUDRAFT_708021 [Cronartium quercuum f. sp. fusiforme G11]
MLTYKSGSAASQLLQPIPYKSCNHTLLYDPPTYASFFLNIYIIYIQQCVMLCGNAL